MDYTNVYSSFIYKFRNDISDFRVDDSNNLDAVMFERIQDSIIVELDDGPNLVLSCFNIAHYLTTIILLEKYPKQYIASYIKASENIGLKHPRYKRYLGAMTLAMVYNYLCASGKVYSDLNNKLLKGIWNYYVRNFNDSQKDGKARFLFFNNVLGPSDLEKYNIVREDFEPIPILEIVKNEMGQIALADNYLYFLESIKKLESLDDQILATSAVVKLFEKPNWHFEGMKMGKSFTLGMAEAEFVEFLEELVKQNPEASLSLSAVIDRRKPKLLHPAIRTRDKAILDQMDRIGLEMIKKQKELSPLELADENQYKAKMEQVLENYKISELKREKEEVKRSESELQNEDNGSISQEPSEQEQEATKELMSANAYEKIIFFATVLSTAYDDSFTNQQALSELICLICGGSTKTFQPRISKLSAMADKDHYEEEVVRAAKKLVEKLERITKEKDKGNPRLQEFINSIKSEFEIK